MKGPAELGAAGQFMFGGTGLARSLASYPVK
jgi:hypothetical protein